MCRALLLSLYAVLLPAAAARADEADAVKALEKLGAKITRDDKLPGKPVIAVNLYYSAVTDAGLKELAPLKALQRLDLEKTKVTDAGVKELQKHCPTARSSADPASCRPRAADRPRRVRLPR